MYLNQFMIGLYGGFDEIKYARDFRDGFYGIEACMFETEDDRDRLLAEANRRGFAIGVHYPFRVTDAPVRDALFLSPDPVRRAEAFQRIEEELDMLSTMSLDYVLFHYPKPVLLDDRVNWDSWHFADATEWIYESQYPLSELVDKTEELFRWLTEQSQRYHFTPVLEFDALNQYVYGTDFLETLLRQYPAIKLCLDTGRLFFQSCIDPHFDARAVLRKYAKYAYSIHLWTLQIQDGAIQHSRHPVLPELSPLDGWAPIEEYLTIVRAENRNVKIMFEHKSERVDEEQLQQCYEWVERLLK